MKRSKLTLTALALTLAASASAQGLFGIGGPEKQILTPVTVEDLPNAHWRFVEDSAGNHAVVEGYSPNVDTVGFPNASKCYGHSLLSTRWFQYIVKPLKSGTLERITPEEFRDFFSGYLEYAPGYDVTAANVDAERLQPYSMYNDKARVAIGKLVGLYHELQFNSWDHNDEMYEEPEDFREDLADRIRSTGLPPQVAMFGDGGHAINAYKVLEGTVVFGNTDGGAGTRVKGWKISMYDPNEPGSGDDADDAEYEEENYWVMVEGGGGFIGFSELMERDYDGFLRQSSTRPDGTWNIPDGKYGITSNTEDDSGELASWWHWNSVDDDDARVISGLESAD